MLQPKHLSIAILLPLTTLAAPPAKAHTTALLTANFYPNCPSTSSSPSSNHHKTFTFDPQDPIPDTDPDFDSSPSLSFSHSPISNDISMDVSSHYEITSTAPLHPNTCVPISIPLEYSSLVVNHLSVSASIQHPRRGASEKCGIAVYELPGCEQDPVLEVEVGGREREVESGCVKREFLAFDRVWARLNCEVEEKKEDEKKPWTTHGGLANSTSSATGGSGHGPTKGRLSSGKRRTKLPIF